MYIEINKSIRAKELRIIYFEEYIKFEHFLKNVAKFYIRRYKMKNKSLSRVIKDLGKVNSSKNLKLPISEIKQHHNIRNWLAHQPSNAVLPKKYINKIQEIKKLNLFLKNVKM